MKCYSLKQVKTDSYTNFVISEKFLLII